MRIGGVQVSIADQFKRIETPSDVWRLEAPRTDYMAHVSHDARNILAALVSNVDWLRANIAPTTLSADLESGLLDIETCCERLTGILEDALLATRPESLALRIGPVSVGALVASVLRRLQKRLQSAGVRIQVSGDKDTSVLVDRFLVSRLLERLLERGLEEETAGTALSLFYASDGKTLTLSLSRPARANGEARSGDRKSLHDQNDFRDPVPFCVAVVRAHGGTMALNPTSPVDWELRIPAVPARGTSNP